MTPQMGAYTLEDDVARMAAHVADVDSHIYTPWSQLVVGQYYHLYQVEGDAVLALAANQVYACPLTIPFTVTLDRLRVYVSALSVGDFARLFICQDNGAFYPGAVVDAGGLVSVAAIAFVEAIINVQLTRGLWWACLLSEGTPSVARAYTQVGPLGLDVASNWGIGNYNVAHAWGIGDPPDPFPAAAVTGGHWLKLAMRVASIP